MLKCMVCGGPSEHRIPLSFCDKCKDTPEADKVRKEHREWFEKIRRKKEAMFEIYEEDLLHLFKYDPRKWRIVGALVAYDVLLKKNRYHFWLEEKAK